MDTAPRSAWPSGGRTPPGGGGRRGGRRGRGRGQVNYPNTQNYHASPSLIPAITVYTAPWMTLPLGERTPPGGGRGRGRGRGRGGGRGTGRGRSEHNPAQTTMMENRASTEPNAKPAPSKLNPNAKEWHPASHRCLFLTLSYGRYIPDKEIVRFFNCKYGECVERVYLHWPRRKSDNMSTPLFGKIVFKDPSVPQQLTANGTKQCEFTINGKPLWCKKFDPTKTRSLKWINK